MNQRDEQYRERMAAFNERQRTKPKNEVVQFQDKATEKLCSILANPISINQRGDRTELKAALKIVLMDCNNVKEIDPDTFDRVLNFVGDNFG